MKLSEKEVGHDNIFCMQAEFCKAGDIDLPNSPTQNLVIEEYNEWLKEQDGTDEGIKETIDLIYVCAQHLNRYAGADESMALFKAVHRHNMTKFPNGVATKDFDGKVLKPAGFDKGGWKKDFDKILRGTR